jgi:predicted RNA-binding protein YlxR (DUF448 family)
MANGRKRPKHVPERTCVVCRRKRPKWDLARIVRTPHGAVEIDSRGKKAGRGAYLCSTRSCWEIGLKGAKLDRVLKTTINEADRAQLAAYCESLPSRDETTDIPA